MIWNRVKAACPKDKEDEVKQFIANGVDMYVIMNSLK
jgi:hypothetical protein